MPARPSPDQPPAAEDTPSAVQDPAPDPAWRYTAPFPCVYPHVPLTAEPGTVFARPDWPPPDGRWEPAAEPPNREPDNAPAAPEN